MYRIVDDGGSPALLPRRTFAVVDARVSDRWEVFIEPLGRIGLSTPALQTPGFFEDLFDRVAGTLDTLLAETSLDEAETLRLRSWFHRS